MMAFLVFIKMLKEGNQKFNVSNEASFLIKTKINNNTQLILEQISKI